jgi:acylphosphatase
MKHFNIIVSGKVHDVFFRDSTQKFANELGLFGFVENHPDKTVYIEVEGSEEKIQPFVSWCHLGPKEARVENVEITEGQVQNFTEFRIK